MVRVRPPRTKAEKEASLQQPHLMCPCQWIRKWFGQPYQAAPAPRTAAAATTTAAAEEEEAAAASTSARNLNNAQPGTKLENAFPKRQSKTETMQTQLGARHRIQTQTETTETGTVSAVKTVTGPIHPDDLSSIVSSLQIQAEVPELAAPLITALFNGINAV